MSLGSRVLSQWMWMKPLRWRSINGMEQATIRYILLAIGAIIILAIFWDGMRQKKSRERDVELEYESTLELEALQQAVEPEFEIPHEEAVPEKKVEADRYSETIYIVAMGDRLFGGYQILQALLGYGLHYGKSEKFFYYAQGERIGTSEPLFSVTPYQTESQPFNIHNMRDFFSDKLILSVNPKSTEDTKLIFSAMRNTAKLLAEVLNGEIKNADH